MSSSATANSKNQGQGQLKTSAQEGFGSHSELLEAFNTFKIDANKKQQELQEQLEARDKKISELLEANEQLRDALQEALWDRDYAEQGQEERLSGLMDG
ncbi:hypothetical protein SLS58_005826 [Diplodia intermedia]|uniref:Uncharacterized protein n=1 Tax=Diplodia intermedia TaxID=856260 RepID=A0ABR3TQ63_9PEZI